MSIQLSNPYLERDAIRSPNFFNGRLLSAEDMSAERSAMRRSLEQLGRAAGDGIAHGLYVQGEIGGPSVAEPVVSVSAGLAVNRVGQAMELNQSVNVSLLQPPGSTAPNGGGASRQFHNCARLAVSAYVAGEGLYLLTLRPVEGREGRAPASGLGNLTVCCGDKSVVAGVEFRLVRVTALDGLLSDSAHLRNAVAYRCFGEPDGAIATNPFAAPARYGLVDSLRPAQLADSEVPLAILHWTSAEGTRFIDNWAVRRQLHARPSLERPPIVGSARRRAEGEAMFLQFQEHVNALASTGTYNIRASSVFRFLPAAGVLPVSGLGSSVGFDRLLFFSDQTCAGPAVVEGAQVAALLDRALGFPPIDLQSQELIWVYLVRENLQAIATSTAPYFIFANGNLPYLGNARFDLARADFSNVSLV
jgi:hypothetical protein